MAKQRYINTRFWSDNFISSLNPLDRYLFLYFLTNEHTNISGIYEVPLRTISFETGIELDMLKKMLERLDTKIYYIDGWIYIKNFAKHQAVNESIVKGISASKRIVPDSVLKKIAEIDKTKITQEKGVSVSKVKVIEKEENTEIPEVIKEFESINPACARMYGNKTQRGACADLIKEYGFERIISVIRNTLPITNKLQYFPVIDTPHKLREKWTSLESAIIKKQSESKANKEKYPVI